MLAMLVARAQVDGRCCYGEVEEGMFYPLAGDAFAGAARDGDPLPLRDISLVSPTTPSRILFVMGGFLPADGTPLAPDAVPWLLPKVPSVVSGDGAEIIFPEYVSGTVVAEVELAVVIGKELSSASVEEARDGIFGFTIFNDVTAPEFMAAHDYYRAKSGETFASMGPWVRTDLSDEAIAAGLRLTCRVNGVVRGVGTTARFKFPPSTVVSFASTYTTLHPGDVITLGTPQECDVAPGDSVELEVEGVGVLHNRVVRPR